MSEHDDLRTFQEITGRYAALRIAVVGDYSCDRYLEIDPAKTETSIETGLPVHNVTRVRPTRRIGHRTEQSRRIRRRRAMASWLLWL